MINVAYKTEDGDIMYHRAKERLPFLATDKFLYICLPMAALLKIPFFELIDLAEKIIEGSGDLFNEKETVIFIHRLLLHKIL